MYHFQSKTHGDHVSSDKVFGEINIKFDELMEIYQGMYEKRIIVDKNTKIFINNVKSKKEIKKLNKDFIIFLLDLKDENSNLHVIDNVIDDIILLINKFDYLLSFE